MPDKKLIPLDVRDVSKKGGSLSLTLPADVVKILELKPHDKVAFFYDEGTKQIIIQKAVATYTTPSGLSFSISKELAKKLLKEGKSG